MECGYRFCCEASGIFWFDFECFFLLAFTFCLKRGDVDALDVSPDGNVVVGSSGKVLFAHTTDTDAVSWRKEMPGNVWALRIHGCVVVVSVDKKNILALDVTAGDVLHTLPSAGEHIRGICVFDGMRSHAILDLVEKVQFSHIEFLS